MFVIVIPTLHYVAVNSLVKPGPLGTALSYNWMTKPRSKD